MRNLRREAAEAGNKIYLGNQPCKKCNHAWRYTSTGGCVQCAKRFSTQYSNNSKYKLMGFRKFVSMVPSPRHAEVEALCDQYRRNQTPLVITGLPAHLHALLTDYAAALKAAEGIY